MWKKSIPYLANTVHVQNMYASSATMNVLILCLKRILLN